MPSFTMQLGVTLGEAYPGTGIYFARTRLQYAGEMCRLSAEGKSIEAALADLEIKVQEAVAARGWPPIR